MSETRCAVRDCGAVATTETVGGVPRCSNHGPRGLHAARFKARFERRRAAPSDVGDLPCGGCCEGWCDHCAYAREKANAKKLEAIPSLAAALRELSDTAGVLLEIARFTGNAQLPNTFGVNEFAELEASLSRARAALAAVEGE